MKMRTTRAKVVSLTLIATILLSMTVLISPAKAINVTVNQDTFVLSNEAPGYGISALVNAGYGDYNLYQTLVTIQGSTDPSVSGILTDEFLATLQNAPASSQIFTTHLKDVNSQGTAIAINTDGTFQTVSIFGSAYYGDPRLTRLSTDVEGVGKFIMVFNSTGIVTSWTINGPLAGMTTTYNVFGIFYVPSTSQTPTPTPTPTATPRSTTNPTTTSNPTSTSTVSPTASPSSTPAAPEFGTWIILLILVMAVAAALIVKLSKLSESSFSLGKV